ncbi:hypothetical protein [Azomonas macrocytogenes]|uniref:Uncharacterized protein n=1 Tax=Azomonas macrocytogenes TaxID=69962 RepID=A0A839SZP1_AZOMA|nr:hypothetical protein [Azomonas macrocytogenes]MBB3101716.1 hypothetical protein [Azomonas macrocytogenes]
MAEQDKNFPGYVAPSGTDYYNPLPTEPLDREQDLASSRNDERSKGYGETQRKESLNPGSQATDGQQQNDDKVNLDNYRSGAASELERVAQSARAAAADLEQDRPGLSQYVSDIAQGMVKMAENLRNKKADDLYHDAERMARENPGLFIAGSIALGFGLTRFAKASSQYSSGHSASTATTDSWPSTASVGQTTAMDTGSTDWNSTREGDPGLRERSGITGSSGVSATDTRANGPLHRDGSNQGIQENGGIRP